MRVIRYRSEDAERWDALVTASTSGTFLHSRRFLSYHRDRFKDESVLVLDERSRLVGVLPAGVDPVDDARVLSHPGATYGGLVHSGRLTGEAMIQALSAVCGHFAERGFSSLRYKAVPTIYHRMPAMDDRYALFRAGAKRYRCDLSSTIDLANRGPVSARRRRSLRKATKAGVALEQGTHLAQELWEVLSANLSTRHGARPVHSVEEILELHRRLPEGVECMGARLDRELVAGVVLFHLPTVTHAQYIAANERGFEVCALDRVFEQCIERAARAGKRFFDFGISTEREGSYLNAGLNRFKTEFGSGGVTYEFYEIDLAPRAPGRA